MSLESYPHAQTAIPLAPGFGPVEVGNITVSGQEPQQHDPWERRMSHHTTPHQHGHTVAAWTTVTIVLVGFLTSGVAVVAAEPVVFWLGMGVAALGVFAGKLLSMAGMGAMPSYEVQSPVDTSLEGPDLAGHPSESVRGGVSG